MHEGNSFFLVIVVAVAGVLYFLPALIASRRRHHNAMAIFILNLFLGWTFLGWVAALVWASTAVRRATPPAIDTIAQGSSAAQRFLNP